jgi:chorismate mutase
MEEQLTSFRKKIDALDQRITEQLNERARIVLEVREIKNRAQLPICDPQREQEIFTRLALANKGPLSDGDLKEIYKNILHHMKNFE